MKLRRFLNIVIFVPKYSFSSGNVKIPTVIKVPVKADKIVYDTPFESRIAHIGKATNPGIKAIDPSPDAIKREVSLFSPDKRARIVLSGMKKNSRVTNITVSKRVGNISKNLENANFKDFLVFSRLKINEMIRQMNTKMYKKYIALFSRQI